MLGGTPIMGGEYMIGKKDTCIRIDYVVSWKNYSTLSAKIWIITKSKFKDENLVKDQQFLSNVHDPLWK